MTQRMLIILIVSVTLAAAFTIGALFVFGVPPIYVLVLAMVGSVAARLWTRRS